MKTKPCLPANDPAPPARAAALAKGKKDYRFRYDYHDIVAAESVPLRDKSDAHWWTAVMGKMAELEVNKLASKSPVENLEDLAKSVWDKLSALAPEKVARESHKRSRSEPTDSDGLDSYARMYATIAAPEIVKVWERDDIFSWQAVAGCNPYMIRRLTEPMPNFAMTEAVWERSTGKPGYEAALKAGRVYVADYAMLDGLPVGEIDGRTKFNFAPIAMYWWDGRALTAVAIQTGQKPGTLFTPKDGMSWRMARTTVMTAEGNVQGIISHFALCHQVMESVILSARRQLAPNHPLRVLLEPHFENTLITNDIAMTNLIGPDGYMERLQSPTLEASLALATRQIDAFELLKSAPHEDYVARGVDDFELLGDYPARDDGAAVWSALEPFVKAYVELYYTSAADVAGDDELQGWVREMGARDGGRLSGMRQPATVDDVAGLLARILFRCTAYHASINYSSFPLFSFAPNVQTAGFAPGPTGGSSDTEAALEAMIPPYDLATQGLSLFWEITVQLNRLGHYPEGHFVDQRVAPLLDAYQARLDAVEAAIAQKNRSRPLEYGYQLPSRVSQSIHV